MADEGSPFKVGQKILMILKEVTPEQAALIMGSNHIPMYGLLPHEQRTSVMHFTVSPRSTPLVSGHQVILSLGGFRRFVCSPVYSELSQNVSVHKVVQRVEPGQSAVASIYAPIHFAPGPALLFDRSTAALISSGSIYGPIGPDPRRILLTRATLTGQPYKIHSRAAVVRWMFPSPADVAWFKPVELTTKSGRRGHIRMSVGTHGNFKALFDKPLLSNEPVAMHLYKRAFPLPDTTHPI